MKLNLHEATDEQVAELMHEIVNTILMPECVPEPYGLQTSRKQEHLKAVARALLTCLRDGTPAAPPKTDPEGADIWTQRERDWCEWADDKLGLECSTLSDADQRVQITKWLEACRSACPHSEVGKMTGAIDPHILNRHPEPWQCTTCGKVLPACRPSLEPNAAVPTEKPVEVSGPRPVGSVVCKRVLFDRINHPGFPGEWRAIEIADSNGWPVCFWERVS